MSRAVAVLFLVASLIAVVSCEQPGTQINAFGDDVIIQIHDFQDRRTSDSLYRFLNHENVLYREKAAWAFASIQDTASTEHLGKLLRDTEPAVRTAAAFALGQTGGVHAADFLLRALHEERDSATLQVILEAIGKSADPDEIPAPDFRAPGIPWMYYRIGLRFETPPQLNHAAARYLAPDSDRMSRLGAAHFFARSKTITIEDALPALVNALRNDPDQEVRMASAWALRKAVTELSKDALSWAALNDSDYRVRANAVSALASFPLSETRATLIRACQDSILQVSVAAAGTLGQVATEGDQEELAAVARRATHWRTQALLFQAANLSGDPDLNAEVMGLYRTASNPYQKAALLTALSGRDVVDFVSQVLFTTDIPAIRTSAAQVIVGLNYELAQDPDAQRMFFELYKRGIALNDLAVTGTFTDALADETLGFRRVVTDLSFLYKARDRFALPRDYESYVPLERAIAFFENREPQAVDRPFNNPIDWDLVRRIPAHQRAVVSTTKGDIVFDLHVDEAPGSVANFVRLVRDGYYERKTFHRVVSNFVVQGGCNRGDGWGSADYSIRSEFSGLRYVTGSVGLASAGKDTESTQWFITHSPTPHLDGRYTVFGTVSEGMDNVHRLEVGDSILHVALEPALNPG
ncbi:MAG TPA: peptidylprolyl isomerase [Cyclobacteriaceae bacterium]|nr:peptidylprolyl isomerase [Cyclobacteriaceae bacterium]